MTIDYFEYPVRYGALTDIGRKRKTSQDEVILAPEAGFFGVSDGMGGLSEGGASSVYVKKAMPLLLRSLAVQWKCRKPDAGSVAADLRNTVQMLSDRLFAQGNTESYFRFGATIAGVLLYGDRAVFVCLGDSRGYLLRRYRRLPQQITEDMNTAGLLVRAGEMSREEALNNPGSSRLYAFVGMAAPAAPEIFIEEVHPGDRILLCSDGLYGMIPEREISRLMRSSKSPAAICRRLIDTANNNGGRDNIAAVYIKIR